MASAKKEDSLRWIKDEMFINTTAGYGQNLKSVKDNLSDQKQRQHIVTSYGKQVSALPENDKKDVEEKYGVLKYVADKRTGCLDNVSKIAELETSLGALSIELSTTASSLVSSHKEREVPANAADGVPAASQRCIQGVKDNWQWLKELMSCAEIHLQNSSDYHQFFHEITEYTAWMPVELKAAQDKVKLHEQVEGSNQEGQRWLFDLKELLTLFLHWQNKVEKVFARSKKIVPVHLRTEKLQYFRPVESMANYETNRIVVKKGEELLLTDNSDPESWQVRNVTHNETHVPSIICLIPGPHPEAIQAAVSLRLQLLTEWTLNVKRVGKSIILFTILVLRDFSDDEKKKLKAMSGPSKTAVLESLKYIEETLAPYWKGYKGFDELQSRIQNFRKIIAEQEQPKFRDEQFEKQLVDKVQTVEDLLKNYRTMWSQWEAYKILVESSRQADNLLIVDKWEQLKFISMEELRKLWQQGLAFGDGDNMDFDEWMKMIRTAWNKKTQEEEERIRKEEEERRRKEEEEKRRREEEERKRREEEERKKREEEERRRKEEEERKRKEEEERKRKEEEERKRKEEEERKRREEEERKRKEEEERKRKEEEERKRREEEERKRKEEEERKRREEEERKRKEEEEKRRLEEERKRLEELKRKEEEERKRREEEERIRKEEEERKRKEEEERKRLEEERRRLEEEKKRLEELKRQEEERIRKEKEEQLRLEEEARLKYELETTIERTKETHTTDQVSTAEHEEERKFVITGVVDPASGYEVSMQDAIKKGIINNNEGTYVNPRTGFAIPIPQAMNEGKIKGELQLVKKSEEKKTDMGLITIRTQRESRPYTIQSVKDAKTDKLMSIDEAINNKILDEKKNIYHNSLTNKPMSLADALESGLLVVKYDETSTPSEPEVVTITYAIYWVKDRLRNEKVSFSKAMQDGLLNIETGQYFNNTDGEFVKITDAIKSGDIRATVVKDPAHMKIDPKNIVVVEALDNAKQRFLGGLKTLASMRKAGGE